VVGGPHVNVSAVAAGRKQIPGVGRHAIRDAFAGAKAARVVLAGVVKRLGRDGT
jgi:hypothetical protein